MDITPQKRPNQATRQQRDRTVHRRAYLDTYAKNRVHIDTTGRPQKVQQQAPMLADVVPQQPKIQSTPQQPTTTVSANLDNISYEDVSTLLHSAQLQQTAVPAASRNIQTSAVPTDQTLVAPKQNRISELKQVFKASSATKKQQRILQKQQQERLKNADVQQVNDPAYFSALTQNQQQFSRFVQAETDNQPRIDTASLLDESGSFATSDTQHNENDQRVEANLRALYAGPLSKQIAASSENSASASHMRTIIASAFACGIMAVGIFTLFGNYSSQPVVAQPIGSPVIEVEAPTPQPQTGSPVATNNKNKASNDIVPADPSHPVRLIIGSLGINAPVQGLGTTPEGLMAVPESYGIVGWYNKGAVPGQPGPAVLAGHYTGGNKGVFDKLKDAEIGQLITVANGKGQTFTYKITAKNEYDKDKVPMAELFKNSAESRLEIITCSGKWQSAEYNKRLVVSAEIIR